MSFNQGTSENQPSTPFIPGPAPVAPVARMVPEAADGEQAAVAPPGPAAMMAPASASAAPFPIDPALTATPAGLGQGSAAQAYSQAQMQVATTAPVPTVQNVAAAHVTIAPAPAPPTAPSQELVPYNHAPQTGTPSDATSTAAAGHAQVDITQLPAVHPKAPPNPLNNFRNAAPSYHLPDGSVVFPGGEVPYHPLAEFQAQLIAALRRTPQGSMRLLGVPDNHPEMFDPNDTQLAAVPRSLRAVALLWFQLLNPRPKPWGLPQNGSVLIPRPEPPAGLVSYRNGGPGGGGRYIDEGGVIHGLSTAQAYQMLKKAGLGDTLFRYNVNEYNRATGENLPVPAKMARKERRRAAAQAPNSALSVVDPRLRGPSSGNQQQQPPSVPGTRTASSQNTNAGDIGRLLSRQEQAALGIPSVSPANLPVSGNGLLGPAPQAAYRSPYASVGAPASAPNSSSGVLYDQYPRRGTYIASTAQNIIYEFGGEIFTIPIVSSDPDRPWQPSDRAQRQQLEGGQGQDLGVESQYPDPTEGFEERLRASQQREANRIRQQELQRGAQQAQPAQEPRRQTGEAPRARSNQPKSQQRKVTQAKQKSVESAAQRAQRTKVVFGQSSLPAPAPSFSSVGTVSTPALDNSSFSHQSNQSSSLLGSASVAPAADSQFGAYQVQAGIDSQTTPFDSALESLLSSSPHSTPTQRAAVDSPDSTFEFLEFLNGGADTQDLPSFDTFPELFDGGINNSVDPNSALSEDILSTSNSSPQDSEDTMARQKRRSEAASMQQLFRQDTNLQAVLNHPRANEVLQQAGVDMSSLNQTSDEMNTSLAAFREDGTNGRHNLRFIREATQASAARAAGDFDDYENAQFAAWLEADQASGAVGENQQSGTENGSTDNLGTSVDGRNASQNKRKSSEEENENESGGESDGSYRPARRDRKSAKKRRL